MFRRGKIEQPLTARLAAMQVCASWTGELRSETMALLKTLSKPAQQQAAKRYHQFIK